MCLTDSKSVNWLLKFLVHNCKQSEGSQPNRCAMIPLNTITAFGLLLIATADVSAAAANKGGVDFDRDIRPILADNCFACHGPDEKERKAKLRFDRKEDAFKPAKSGDYAIVPGDPARSKLIERITATDPDDVMPPVKT